LLIQHVRLCRGGAPDEGWALLHEGHIALLGAGTPPPLGEVARLDGEGAFLAPGFLDLHVHGALGQDTMDATPQALRQMAHFYAQHGVTGFLATTMAAPPEAILAALENIAAVMRAGTGGAMLLGAHVEGPYLDVAQRGCQEAGHIRPADPAEYAAWWATGVVRLITLAPEYAPNRVLLREAVARRITVAVGHSRATYEQLVEAVADGATQVTHLYNGLEPLHHRAPGVVGAGLAIEALSCQLIADNIHVHPAVLRATVRAKGAAGLLLVSDAMRGTGMPDGVYELGGQRVTVRAGQARLDDGTLAGSTLTLERALRNILAASGLSLAEALPMLTSNPARALGLQGRKGRLAVGYDADLVLLDEQLAVRATLVGGEIVFRAE
jgi:N-acetylglucosamine-6-phosphate deacetylase